MAQDNYKWCRRALAHRRVHLTDVLPAKSLYSSSESSITQDLRNVNLRLRLKWMKRPPSLWQTSLLAPPGLQLRETHSFYLLHAQKQGSGEQAETSLSLPCLGEDRARVKSWSGSAWGFIFTGRASNTVRLHCQKQLRKEAKPESIGRQHLTKLNRHT